MRFFTPESYKEFNSVDDAVADRADEAWEESLANYRRHLEAIRSKLPSEASKIAELDLHDAEVLAFDSEHQAIFPGPPDPRPALSAVASLLLQKDQTIYWLTYVLADHVRENPATGDWPFSKSRKHWLYDELDVAADRPGSFVHRILFSDGSVAEIPFVSAITGAVSLPEVVARSGAA
jgi:hypothetical protein